MDSTTNIAKNAKTKETYAATLARRTSQTCRVFKVKVQSNKLNIAQRETLKMMFVEAKWMYNHILALSKQDGSDVFSLKYTELGTVTHYDKDGNELKSELTRLSSQMKQGVLEGFCQNIKNLSKAKRKGCKVGALKFLSEYKTINLKQADVSYRILSKSRVKVQGIKKPLQVNGLKQFIYLPEYELANAKLIMENGDYYIAFTVYTPREDKLSKPLVGCDMGCKTCITLSNGEKYDFKVEESEQVKQLQRKLNRQQNGSNNRWKTRLKLRRLKARDSRRKDDEANKIVHSITERYTVVMQDEQVAEWAETNGKTVSQGVIGRVKARLLSKPDTVVLSKWLPTTKLCTCCGHRVELTLRDRTFVCSECGCREDRDVHAAGNMLWFYRNKIGVGRTELTPVEIDASISEAFSLKQEAAESSVQR
jgi:putative transposase